MMTGRRAPIIAGVIMGAVAVLVVLLVVNPKRAAVAAAQSDLEDARAEQITLQSQLASLEQAKADAPENRKIIRQVEQQLPPTVDEQGLILLLSNAATSSGCNLTATSVSSPVFDPAQGFSIVPASLTVTGGYFSLDEFLFQIETLRRAAKVLSITLAPVGEAGATTSVGTLSMQVSLEMYSTDANAGPGSEPGPTDPDAGSVVAPAATTPTTTG